MAVCAGLIACACRGLDISVCVEGYHLSVPSLPLILQLLLALALPLLHLFEVLLVQLVHLLVHGEFFLAFDELDLLLEDVVLQSL